MFCRKSGTELWGGRKLMGENQETNVCFFSCCGFVKLNSSTMQVLKQICYNLLENTVGTLSWPCSLRIFMSNSQNIFMRLFNSLPKKGVNGFFLFGDLFPQARPTAPLFTEKHTFKAHLVHVLAKRTPVSVHPFFLSTLNFT